MGQIEWRDLNPSRFSAYLVRRAFRFALPNPARLSWERNPFSVEEEEEEDIISRRVQRNTQVSLLFRARASFKSFPLLLFLLLVEIDFTISLMAPLR